MTWKTLCFGSENPARGVVAGYSLLFAILALCFYGMTNDFFPSKWMIRIGGLFAVTISLVLMSGLIAYNLSGANPNFRGPRSRLIWAGPLCFLLLVGFAWIAISHGLAGIFTLTFGEHFSSRIVATTSHTSSRRSCDYRVKADAFNSGFPNYVCISRSYYEAHPNAQVEMTIAGKETFFGRAVTGLYGEKAASKE